MTDSDEVYAKKLATHELMQAQTSMIRAELLAAKRHNDRDQAEWEQDQRL